MKTLIKKSSRLTAAFGLALWLGGAAAAAAEGPAAGAFSCEGTLSRETGVDILNKVQFHYSALKSFEASFTQDSHLAALDQSELSSGQVWFLKPGRMKWIYQVPEPQTFIVREETLWLYQPEQNQIVVDKFSKVLLSELPAAFLMGLGDLSKKFELLSACRNSDGVVLELAPRGKEESSLQGFWLLVNAATFFPEGARVSDVGGNLTSIILREIKTDMPSIVDGLFKAEYPRGVDLIDRRAQSPL